MRHTLLFLLSIILLTSITQALTWSKRSYGVLGSRVLRADFDGDGFADLLIVGDKLSILPNAGNGTFDSARTFTTNQKLTSVILLDFNRDNRVDVAGCDANHNLVVLK